MSESSTLPNRDRLTQRKTVPRGWRRGEPLIYRHGENGNHCLEPESFQRPRHSYSADDIGLIWFTSKEDCDEWLKWWNEPEAIVMCPACGGEGNDTDPCGYCDGAGTVTSTRAADYRPLSPEEYL